MDLVECFHEHFLSSECHKTSMVCAAPDPGICYGGGGGGRFTRGAAMYAKLFERRRGVQSAYDGGGVQSASRILY